MVMFTAFAVAVGHDGLNTAQAHAYARAMRAAPNTHERTLLEANLLAKLLDLRPGAAFADVGAWDGNYTLLLSRSVLPRGQAIATDQASRLNLIREAAARERLNLTVVEATADDAGLAPSSLDAILLRTSFHHHSRPASALAQFDAALRDGGRLLLVENAPQGTRNNRSASWRLCKDQAVEYEWAKEQEALARTGRSDAAANCTHAQELDSALHPLGAGMGISRDVVYHEARAAGFRLKAELSRWPTARFGGEYALLFLKPSGATPLAARRGRVARRGLR